MSATTHKMSHCLICGDEVAETELHDGTCLLCLEHRTEVTAQRTGSKVTPVLYRARCRSCAWHEVGSTGTESIARRWASEHRTDALRATLAQIAELAGD